MRSRHVMGIAGQAITRDLAIDACTAGERLLFAFQKEHGSAFSRNHALAVAIKGLADLRGNRSQPRKSGVGDAGEGVRTASQHYVGPAGAQKVRSMRDGIISGGAGGGNHHDFPGQTQFHGYVPGNYVTRIAGDELSPYLLQIAGDIVIVKLLMKCGSPDVVPTQTPARL